MGGGGGWGRNEDRKILAEPILGCLVSTFGGFSCLNGGLSKQLPIHGSATADCRPSSRDCSFSGDEDSQIPSEVGVLKFERDSEKKGTKHSRMLVFLDSWCLGEARPSKVLPTRLKTVQ